MKHKQLEKWAHDLNNSVAVFDSLSTHILAGERKDLHEMAVEKIKSVMNSILNSISQNKTERSKK